MVATALDGKVAVVVGGATGIGKAAAHRLAREGAAIVLLSRRKDRLEEAAEEIGAGTVFIPTDIGVSAEVCGAFEQIADQFGRVDILVNSAGVTRVKLIEDASDDDIAVSVNTNLLGPIYTTRSAIPLLKAAGGGDIVNISSECTLDHMPLATLYMTTKRGLNGFSQAMNRELRDDGIRVTLVILGAVRDTAFMDNFADGVLERVYPVWEADGYLTRMSGIKNLSTETVADVLHHIVTRPPEVMLDVVHVRPA
jgi:NAD(P)-dependent dehydrogenase (short-subunit alcohol dehydrogenase family)